MVDVALLDLGAFADIAVLVVVDVIIPFVVSPSEMLKNPVRKYTHLLSTVIKQKTMSLKITNLSI